jgi:hypothetical protein
MASGRRWRRAVSDHFHDGTGICSLLAQPVANGHCFLAYPVGWSGGWWCVAAVSSEAEQCPTMIAWCRNDHPCWLKLVAKGHCSGSLTSCFRLVGV